jgi:hypothetical protein
MAQIRGQRRGLGDPGARQPEADRRGALIRGAKAEAQSER